MQNTKYNNPNWAELFPLFSATTCQAFKKSYIEFEKSVSQMCPNFGYTHIYNICKNSTPSNT